MTVKIILPEVAGESTGVGTRVFNDRGDEISGVSSINISIEPESIVTATMEVYVGSIECMEGVHALLGTETLQQIATMHGYELTPKPKAMLSDGGCRV